MSQSSSRAAIAKDDRSAGSTISLRFDQVDRYTGEIVTAALVRSFTAAQVTWDGQQAPTGRGQCSVWISPSEDDAGELARLLSGGGKAIVFGRIGPRIAEALKLDYRGPIELPHEWGECRVDPAAPHAAPYDASPATIRYCEAHPLAVASPYRQRPLCRFDFAAEWNNLGYGRVGLVGNAWSAASAVEIGGAEAIARLATPAGDHLVYAALAETHGGAALWFNRPVGPVDSLEWRIIESFLGDYRSDDLPCLPYVSEIPAGWRGAVCARLDCDEAVASARPLVDLYHERGRPISLALLTSQPLGGADLQLMREVIAAGGSVVSHSRTHQPNWGGSYERARAEALESRAWIEQHLPSAGPVRHAVSPFHQNPPYAVAALADCGYEGFVGGIISSDPEYLLGRAGRVPLVPRTIVSHSAQCMLHGDCYRRYGESIDVYCESFDRHLAGRAIFGYLDHPFSDRYQYGWSDEATRAAAHRGLIEHIERAGDVWWASISDVLDFLARRDSALVKVDQSGSLSIDVSAAARGQPLAVCWKGREFVA